MPQLTADYLCIAGANRVPMAHEALFAGLTGADSAGPPSPRGLPGGQRPALCREPLVCGATLAAVAPDGQLCRAASCRRATTQFAPRRAPHPPGGGPGSGHNAGQPVRTGRTAQRHSGQSQLALTQSLSPPTQGHQAGEAWAGARRWHARGHLPARAQPTARTLQAVPLIPRHVRRAGGQSHDLRTPRVGLVPLPAPATPPALPCARGLKGPRCPGAPAVPARLTA
jgi:hypothetical protein